MIYSFNTREDYSIGQVGGKAKALIETSKVGFPIPEGMVLSVDFFNEWMKEIKELKEWKDISKSVTRDKCQLLKDKVSSMSFTSRQSKELNKHMKRLDGDIFAVRSSATEEDLEGASFAGMYNTYLGVKRCDINEYVMKTFLSCFDFRVMEYKKQKRIAFENTAIAIIIQRQIKSDVSGVGFSLNPLSNCYDEVVINASFGLGEAIVSGLVTPDEYVYESYKKEIINKKVNDKQIGLWLTPEGGVKEKKNSNPKKQALSDAQIHQLAELIMSCQEYYKKPIDTEWAYEEGNLYLLQSRPITTYFPVYHELITKPGEDKLLYVDILSITQGYQEPLSVLGSDIWNKMLLITSGGLFTVGKDGTSPILNGKQYFNIYYLYKAFGKALGNTYIYGHDDNVEKVMKTIDPNEFTVSSYPPTTKSALPVLMKTGMGFMMPMAKSLLGGYKKQVATFKKQFNAAIRAIKNYDSNTPFDETVDTALNDLSEIIFANCLPMVGVMTQKKILKMFKNSNVDSELAAIGMELQDNPTSEMGHLMFDIASSSEFRKTKSPQEFVKRIKNKSYTKKFLDMYNLFIKNHGMRTFKEIDIAAKRTYEDIEGLYKRLKDININDCQITKVKKRKLDAYKVLTEKAREGGFEKKFKKQLEIFNGTFGYREYPKYSSVNYITRLRQIAQEIASKLVKQGRLNSVDEIFDLRIEDIVRAQKDENIDLQSQRYKNLAPYRMIANVKDYPLLFDSRGKIYKAKMEVKDGDMLGSSVSPGIIVGKAKVLASPYEKTLKSGEILVTRSTEPSWTPVFINASGLVMEVGGPLQHGGIIAREYGIPCVSGLIGITDLVKDGDLIEVDGSNGVVRILEKASKIIIV